MKKEYKTKSMIIGRMKRKDPDDEFYPCFVSFFDINDPHKSGKVPKEQVEFQKTHKIVIKNLDINYLLAGNDLVINDLESVEIDDQSPHLFISGKQIR